MSEKELTFLRAKAEAQIDSELEEQDRNYLSSGIFINWDDPATAAFMHTYRENLVAQRILLLIGENSDKIGEA